MECSFCHQPSARFACQKCSTTYYCGSKCQQSHWKASHALYCGVKRKWKGKDAAEPPTVDMTLSRMNVLAAFYFVQKSGLYNMVTEANQVITAVLCLLAIWGDEDSMHYFWRRQESAKESLRKWLEDFYLLSKEERQEIETVAEALPFSEQWTRARQAFPGSADFLRPNPYKAWTEHVLTTARRFERTGRSWYEGIVRAVLLLCEQEVTPALAATLQQMGPLRDVLDIDERRRFGAQFLVLKAFGALRRE